MDWDGLELEFVLGPGVENLSRGGYLVFGPGLRGTSGRGGRCMMEMSVAGGGSARFEMAEASLADVGHLQAEGERVLRAMGAGVVAPDRNRWSTLQ